MYKMSTLTNPPIPENLPDPCQTRKIIAFVLSILSPIPGLEAIVWKCNAWGRVVAVSAVIKMLLLIIGFILMTLKERPTAYKKNPRLAAVGVYLIVAFSILSVVQVIFTALCWITETYESVYVKDAEYRLKRQQRISSKLEKK